MRSEPSDGTLQQPVRFDPGDVAVVLYVIRRGLPAVRRSKNIAEHDAPRRHFPMLLHLLMSLRRTVARHPATTVLSVAKGAVCKRLLDPLGARPYPAAVTGTLRESYGLDVEALPSTCPADAVRTSPAPEKTRRT
ncbi:hypothetical protein [Bradyrhizobium sp. 2TAF24]|uniref:hypothetical protein n=1 Tax=Bradyrhizobium sp. 2TAF24 TaxID=3233011 RepID=UPI003F8FAB66